MFDDDETLMEEKILNNCKPYLNLLRTLAKNNLKRPLLRGSAQPYSELTRIAVEPRKKTMNTDEIDHQIANKWFEENFGIPARTHTVFTTTNRGIAKRYGSIHYIFPIGKFSIINSENYPDLFLKLGAFSKLEMYKNLYGKESTDAGNYDEVKELMKDLQENDPKKYEAIITGILDEGDYKKNNYFEAFKNGNEIMLKCKAYYIISADDERVTEFINDFVWDDVFY